MECKILVIVLLLSFLFVVYFLIYESAIFGVQNEPGAEAAAGGRVRDPAHLGPGAHRVRTCQLRTRGQASTQVPYHRPTPSVSDPHRLVIRIQHF